MPHYNPDIHHRQSIRLKEYDYSQAGMYFITICTQHREKMFGEIAASEMHLSDAGRMVWSVWQALPDRFPAIMLDAFIVMPDHIHGIIAITNPSTDLASSTGEPRVRPLGSTTHPTSSTGEPRVRPLGSTTQPRGTLPGTLGRFIQAFKSISTHEYTRGVKEHSWSPFPGKLWHRNYHERIIRDEEALTSIRNYITTNPARWRSE
jgi:REP element-mobilizing transposase RayT